MSWIRALVACSEASRRNVLMEILSRAGLDTLSATTVNEIRAATQKHSIHIVFCDDDLPEGGYREVLHIARSGRFQMQVVLASPLGDLNQYLIAMQVGAFDFIAPPYREAEIISIVNSVSRHIAPQANKGRSVCYVDAGAAPAQDEAAVS